MTPASSEQSPPRQTLGRRLSTYFYGHPRLTLALLLALPLGLFAVAYLGSLLVLLMASVWNVDPFTSEVVHTFTLDNFRRVFGDWLSLDGNVYREVAWRTIKMAALVTVADAVLAFPIAYYMARVATPRRRNLLVVAVLVPLWASYLVKAYAWRTILSGAGVFNWALDPVRPLVRRLLDDGPLARLHLPLAAVHDPARSTPGSSGSHSRLLEASADLGGRSVRTFFKVTLPLAFPAVVAGSIFTFSLTLGDYIAPKLITSEQFIGTVIYDNHGTNLPVAAAFTLVPICVMIAYLAVAKKLKAFEAL